MVVRELLQSAISLSSNSQKKIVSRSSVVCLEGGAVLHLALLNMKTLGPGARLTVLGLPLGENDKLAIENGDDERTSALVASCTNDSLVIFIGRTPWRLLRVQLGADDEAVSLSRTDDKGFTVWEFLSEEGAGR
jgi:hypothetical protein